jgi:hypothetical protein
VSRPPVSSAVNRTSGRREAAWLVLAHLFHDLEK